MTPEQLRSLELALATVNRMIDEFNYTVFNYRRTKKRLRLRELFSTKDNTNSSKKDNNNDDDNDNNGNDDDITAITSEVTAFKA